MEQNVNRRRFLGAAVGTGAAAAWAPSALAHGRHGKDRHHGRGDSGRVPGNRISSQLYSWRRVMERSQADAEKMLRTLARLGYTEVETAGHYGWTATQYKAVLDRYGLKASSGHDGPDFNFPAGWQDSYKTTLEYAKALGQRFTGFAWHPGPHTEERNKFLAARFNEAGEIAKSFDLQFFYHNHDFEFSNKQANGEPLYDILLNETDSDLVKFELDLYWIVYGKEDPNRYLASDPARWPLYHVKDKTWRDRKETQPWENWEDVGPGSIDFPQIFDSGEGRRLDKHFIIEHDWPQFSHPKDEEAEVKTAKSGADYLQSVRW
jgi:sugar phosphate isomerase/epimerase